MARIRWPIVGGLASLGLLVGVLSLFGLWPVWAEFLVWLVVGAAWVTVLHFRVHSRYFLHGFVTAFAGGMLAVLTQVAFMSMYVQNNESVRRDFGSVPTNEVRVVFFGTGLAICLVFGLVTGLALWLTIPREARAR